MKLFDLLIAAVAAPVVALPAAAQSAAAAQPPVWQLPVMLVVFFAIFYLLIIRPQSKRAKDHKNLLGALSKGDEVTTAGGLVGRVDDVGDAFITLEISNNVRIKVQKHAVTAVLPKGTLKSA